MRVTSLGLRTDLMVRRLAGSEIEDHGSCWVVRTPTNPDYYWGNFLVMRSLLSPGDAPEWEGAFVRAFPAARHRAFALDGTDGEVGDPGEVAALGVQPDVSSVLTIASSELVRPSGSATHPERRFLASDRDWEQLVSLRESLYGEPETPAERTFGRRRVAEARALVEAGHAGWAGAFDDGRLVAALGIVGDGSGVARYQDVETHPEHRRQGLARALLQQAGAYAATALAADTLVIVADPDYHAIDLYRAVGFRDRERQVQLEASR